MEGKKVTGGRSLESSGGGTEERGTRRSIYAALASNTLIALAKFVAGFVSGSSAMLSEGAHSVADTTNQVFLLISLKTAKGAPDEDHPYGYGQDRFFWSFLVAVGLFVAGAVFSIYEGVMKIAGDAGGDQSFLVAYVVLGASFVFEGTALTISTREFRRVAREEGRTILEHFRQTRNTTMKVPLYEDVAALIGLTIAASGLILTQATGSHVFDGFASVGVGVVLIVVAWNLGTDSRRLLIGEAVTAEDRKRLRKTMLSFREVTQVFRLLTMHLGPDSVLVNAEIHLVDGLDTDQIEELLERITRALRQELPEVTHTFIEPHPAKKAAR